MNFAKEEPVILGGILSGIGVFLGIRYGAHVNGATQVFPGVSVATFVSFLSRFVGPSSVSDVRGIANDVESLKGQLAPLRKLNGWQSAVAWLHGHGPEVVSIVEAAKADVEDLLHHHSAEAVGLPPLPVATLPTTPAETLAMAQPVAPHVPTGDAVADLAHLVPVAAAPVVEPAAPPFDPPVTEVPVAA